MRRQLDSDALLGIVGIIFYGGAAYFLIGTFFPGVFEFGHDALEWLGGLMPTGRGVAGFIWRATGTVMVLIVLGVFFFKTSLTGRSGQTPLHGLVGVIAGFAILLFSAAYLYSIGFVFWFSVLGGILASAGIKFLFAYWRSRVAVPSPLLEIAYREKRLEDD